MKNCEKCKELQRKITCLENENNYLRKRVKDLIKETTTEEIYSSSRKIGNKEKSTLSIEEKIFLFCSLFQGRKDVYAQRWESKTGKSGYTPVCSNEWVDFLCQKPKIKCSQCPNKKLRPLDNPIIYDHLSGKKFIGIYPLLKNETCHLLAIDFDKETWEKDVKAFFNICKKSFVPALIERSQSGKGAHVWIFFSTPISAHLARNLGYNLLALTMQEHPNIGMDSYDRMFPNQDTLPKGGYGNLIALPLQGKRRKEGNSIFLDGLLKSLDDPWEALRCIEPIDSDQLNKTINTLNSSIMGSNILLQDESNSDEKPWENKRKEDKHPVIDRNKLPDELELVLSNQIYIKIMNCPPIFINELKKVAAFSNPEFYRAQSMRLSTYGKPRVISCSEQLEKYICLPRGCKQELEKLLKHYGVEYQFIDKTNSGKPINHGFYFTLNDEQNMAIEAILKERYGVLSAVTGFGKTVLAGRVIFERKINTLILVHRQQLLEQWVDKLSIMFKVPKSEIGTLCSGKNKLTGNIDISMLQSLSSQGEIKSLVRDYGQIIVDECHHISAFTFEKILKAANPKYVLGLTATLKRKDGHHPIITMQCGPVCYHVNGRKQIEKSRYQHRVKIRKINFNYDSLSDSSNITDIYNALLNDNDRNKMICEDLLSAIENGRNPLLLTERTSHIPIFENILNKHVKNIFILKGGMREKQRKKLLEELFSFPENSNRLIIATGKYIGEGFDDPRLDTLFLALPISWQGTLQQYVGRLHRNYNNKNTVTVYDYVDINIPVLARMYQKRYKKYHSMGYQIEVCENEEIA